MVLAFDDLGGHGRQQMLYRLYWTGEVWTDNDDLGRALTQPGPHGAMVNVLWADNHVKAISKRTLRDILLGMSVWP